MTFAGLSPRARWLAFVTLCLGDMLIVLDSTVVNVALPSIRASLGFSESGLTWVVNAYLLTFGGFLLLGGRLADLYGPRRLFLLGVVAFTIASLVCGLAPTQGALVVARAVQGLAGAVCSAVALALIFSLFPEGPQRVKAMAWFGFISAGGGSIGVLLGGLITSLLDWRWIFLINLPVGAIVIAMALRLLPRDVAPGTRPRLDWGGAVLVTASLMLAVYGVVGTERVGWTSPQTIVALAAAAVLMVAFVFLEARIRDPLVPLSLFRLRSVVAANVIAVLWAAGMFAWFVLAALYLQRVLGYSPLMVGLAFLPSNLIMGAFSFRLSELVVNRFGVRWPLGVGLLLVASGLALFGVAPVGGSFWLHVLPPMLLLGVGVGMAFNPVLLAAMSDTPPDQSGLASGLVNTAFMMGGALGLAVLASVAVFVTRGQPDPAALQAVTDGYHAAFLVGALSSVLAAAIAIAVVRTTVPEEGAAPLAH